MQQPAGLGGSCDTCSNAGALGVESFPGAESGSGAALEPQGQSDYAELIAQMRQWREDPNWRTHKAHTDRWDRALLAFGQTVDDTTLSAMTVAEAQAFADRGWTRWTGVVQAMREIRAAPHADLIAQMRQWREDPEWRTHKAHTDRWDRALLAFGQTVDDTTLSAMTVAEAQAFADRGWTRWTEVAQAMRELESAGQ